MKDKSTGLWDLRNDLLTVEAIIQYLKYVQHNTKKRVFGIWFGWSSSIWEANLIKGLLGILADKKEGHLGSERWKRGVFGILEAAKKGGLFRGAYLPPSV